MIVAGILAVALAAAAPSATAEVLARARAAQGGAAWAGVRTLRVEGRLEAGGLKGTFRGLTDVATGRYRDAFDLGEGTLSGAEGFDGATAWTQDASGQSRPEEGEAKPAAIAEAYRRARAFWFPGRRPGEVRLAGERRERGRRFHVLEVQPAGGDAFTLWVDARTGLFDRVVDSAYGRPRTTTFSDWRAVGGVKLPFTTRVARAGARSDETLRLTRVERDVAVDDGAFALPPPPPRDFGFRGGARETTVPFALENDHVYVDVRLDGRGPYRLLVDTGGLNVLAPALARELGAEPRGSLSGGGVGEDDPEVKLARVERVELGDAWLERQTFYVFPIDGLSDVEGVPVLGLVGYEVFRRFVARLDYAAGRLTLLDPDGWEYAGPGAVLPFEFDEHTPVVEGAVDGLAGKFAVDTGSRSALDLLSPFVERHGLAARGGAERVTGWGVGGPTRSRVARLRELRLGPVVVPGVVAGLSTARKGAFARPHLAGNVGGGVLKRFTLWLDYGRRRLVLEKNAAFAAPFAYDRAGWWLHAKGGGFEVMEVVPGSPAAAAGLARGDVVLAVDGEAPPGLTLPELRRRASASPAGTRLRLRVRSPAGEREVTLTLRDLV